MAPEGWVEIADAKDDIEAELMLGRLREAGIEAQSIKTNTGPGAWLTGTQVPWTPSVILVPAERASEAAEVISVEPTAGTGSRSSHDRVREPGSIAAPSRKGRAWLVWLVAVILLLAFLATLMTDMRDLIGL